LREHSAFTIGTEEIIVVVVVVVVAVGTATLITVFQVDVFLQQISVHKSI
jgi:hypothetical protein